MTAQSRRVPLTRLIETIRTARTPVCYQVLAQHHPEWTGQADAHLLDLEEGTVTGMDRLVETLSPRTSEQRQDYRPAHEDRKRIEAIEQRDARHGVRLSARAVAFAESPQTDELLTHLASALTSLDGPFHRVRGHTHTDDAQTLFEDLCARTIAPQSYDSPRTYLPGTNPESAGIVVTADELPGFCLLDGTRLTPDAQRALTTRPTERTGITLPPPTQLAQYQPPGMALCNPLNHDRKPIDQPLYLSPEHQNRHLVVVGDTGSGKSVLLETAMLTNTHATEGPSICFDYKGGGTAEEYLHIHHAEYGSLEDVQYFDLSRVLPALSFFDIEPLLEAGIPREEARSRKVGHYEEILKGVLGAEKYGEAAESVKVIRNHLRALYDPLHGQDAPTHRDLYEALLRTQRGDGMPATADEQLTNYFNGLAERDRDVFNAIMAGAVGRVETIATDGRLAPLFDHQPAKGDTSDGTETPPFEFTDVIDRDCVVVFDFAGMEPAIKRTLTLVLLSNCWTALKAREQRTHTDHNASLPQVNLYLEEARDVGATRLLDTLLSEGRSFGLAIALGVQFLEQLDSPDPSNKTYQEALNETATFVVGNVSVDSALARVLTTDVMDRTQVETRLSTMARGEWLVRPGTAFGAETVRPFLGQSLEASAGHPASATDRSESQERAFQAAFEAVKEQTADRAGLVQSDVADRERDDEQDEEAHPDEDGAIDPTADLRVDTLLPHTRRLPECVTYDESMHSVCCGECENRYDPSISGLVRAIECCHSLDSVDRDDLPVCELTLKRTPEEIRDSEYSPTQLLFVQAVYNAQQLRYDPREYDLREDSMLRLQEYVGIDTDEIKPLLDADLLRSDTDHPHKMYSASPEGRSVIGESYRQGIDYGHGKGDLEESTQHVFGVVLAIDLLEREYVDDSDSAVETVSPYHDLREGTLPAAAFMGDTSEAAEVTKGYEQRRLDVAGLDEDGEVVVTVEIERINNDSRRAVPADFDKMAACDPEEAIWIVMSRKAGHAVLQALNDPLEGAQRVEKTYSENTPPQQFRIDTPGLTSIYPAEYVRDTLLE
jgi:hypothetical protein